MSAHNYFLNEQRNNVNHLNYYYFTDAFTPEELVKIIEIGEKTSDNFCVTRLNQCDRQLNY